MFHKTVIKAAVMAMGLGLMAALVPQQADAQRTGFVRADRTDGVAREGASRCPQRWREDKVSQGEYTEKRGFCYPEYGNSPAVYLRKGGTCKTGYGVDGEWCSAGHIEHPQLNNPNVMAKANQADRCPAGFYTYTNKCTTELANPPKARVKGSGTCKAGEIAEWGIWCTSDFDHLSVQDIRSAHYRDWNYIYTMTRGGNPRQGPGDEDASEVYQHMFGDDKLDGPVGEANAALVNKRPLTAEQRRILQNANAATAAMLPPEGEGGSSAGGKAAKGTAEGEASNNCDGIKLRGKLGQLARRAAGC